MKRISILGLGYIGLPTAIIAAQAGYDVFGYDIDESKVERINAGDPIIFEPELSQRLVRALSNDGFKAVSELQYADCFIIAVPTPFKENKKPDLSSVFSAGELIAKRIMPGNLVLLESTVPVGTTEKLGRRIQDASGLTMGIDFFVAHCPERVLPGQIFKEIVDNNRIIGGVCQRSCELAHIFYSKFSKGFIHITDDKSAEMVKLIENSCRDVQIAFANQVASMCKTAGLDPYQVIELANKHPRVNILTPTCGVGGHCIAVDPWFLIDSFPHETTLLKTARIINDQKPYSVIDDVMRRAEFIKKNNTYKPKVLGLGITFKPNIDDIRESPALKISFELHKKNDLIEYKIYDPNIDYITLNGLGLEAIHDVWRGIAWADIIVVLVKHKEFTLIREEAFNNCEIIDTCGLIHEIQGKESLELLQGITTKQISRNHSSRIF